MGMRYIASDASATRVVFMQKLIPVRRILGSLLLAYYRPVGAYNHSTSFCNEFFAVCVKAL
jgi:hypothetical protein